MACSPRRRIRFASVASRIDDAARPGRADAPPRKLDCSNDSRDHTLLPYATTSFVLRNAHRSRAQVNRPAIAIAPTLSASTASQPAFVTTYDRPFSGWDRSHIRQFRILLKRILFLERA